MAAGRGGFLIAMLAAGAVWAQDPPAGSAPPGAAEVPAAPMDPTPPPAMDPLIPGSVAPDREAIRESRETATRERLLLPFRYGTHTAADLKAVEMQAWRQKPWAIQFMAEWYSRAEPDLPRAYVWWARGVLAEVPGAIRAMRAVWNALTDDQRLAMLETIQMQFTAWERDKLVPYGTAFAMPGAATQ